MQLNSIDAAKELLTSLKLDTTDISETGIDIMNSIRGQYLKTDSFTSMQLPIALLTKLCERKIDYASFIQKTCIPLINEGFPIAVQSKSGSGKTIAFTVGILPKIITDRTPQCLVISPTKVLSSQIASEMAFFGTNMKINVKNLVTKDDFLGSSAEIYVGCPGTLINLIDKFMNIKFIVIDEADVTLTPEKLGKDTLTILKYIPNAQRLYFSATYSFKIKETIQKIETDNFLRTFKSETEFKIPYTVKEFFLKNPPNYFKKELQTIYEDKNKKPEEIKLFHTAIVEEQKDIFLFKLFDLLPMSQCIIFVARISKVEELKKKFEEDLYKVSFMHGDMDNELRSKYLNDFSEGKTKILISTDIFSRGMDIPLVNAIINYDLPIYQEKPELRTYIHRVGRSGRFGRKGFVLDFCANENELKAIKSISDHLETVSKFFMPEDLEQAWKMINSV